MTLSHATGVGTFCWVCGDGSRQHPQWCRSERFQKRALSMAIFKTQALVLPGNQISNSFINTSPTGGLYSKHIAFSWHFHSSILTFLKGIRSLKKETAAPRAPYVFNSILHWCNRWSYYKYAAVFQMSLPLLLTMTWHCCTEWGWLGARGSAHRTALGVWRHWFRRCWCATLIFKLATQALVLQIFQEKTLDSGEQLLDRSSQPPYTAPLLLHPSCCFFLSAFLISLHLSVADCLCTRQHVGWAIALNSCYLSDFHMVPSARDQGSCETLFF